MSGQTEQVVVLLPPLHAVYELIKSFHGITVMFYLRVHENLEERRSYQQALQLIK